MLNTKGDVEMTPGPGDGASGLSFSPVADYLSASSWDGQVRAFLVVLVLIVFSFVLLVVLHSFVLLVLFHSFIRCVIHSIFPSILPLLSLYLHPPR